MNKFTKVEKIIELLKSVKFWGIVSGVAAAITAIPVVFNWLSFTPEPYVYVGECEIEDEEEIVLNYLMPQKDFQKKCVLPFPLMFCNENDETLEKFYVELAVKTKEIGKGGYMKRILLYSDYLLANEKRENRLAYNETGGAEEQVIGNRENRIGLEPSDEEKNIWMLNFAGDSIVPDELWDSCVVNMEVGSKGVLKKYKIQINTYYADDVARAKEKIRKSMDEDNQSFILLPSLNHIVKTPDSLFISVYNLKSADIYKL